MIQPGDLHNFGRRVTYVERASGNFFQKPRSVFWEWLLFGQTSPLGPIYLAATSLGSSDLLSFAALGAPLFSLDLEFEQAEEGGFSRAIQTAPIDTRPSNEILRRFGWLLAYCYIFGIRDLHRGNLVLSTHRLQPIDAEVVFSKLVLPHETLLLPFKSTGFESSGIGQLFGSLDEISTDDVSEIMKGYIACFSATIEKREEISKLLRSIISENKFVPIRHIMRDTAEYRGWRENSSGRDFTSEELIQLERGDIPYFFKFCGSDSLYFYTSPDRDYRSLSVPERFRSAVDREAIFPEPLLSESRLRFELLPSGLLYLARTLLTRSFEGALVLDETTRLNCKGQSLEFLSSFGAWSATRIRQIQSAQ